MKPRNLIVAAALLAILSGVVWWSSKHPPAGASPDGTASTTAKLIDVPADQLAQIDVKKKDGGGYTLTRASGKWQITAPETLAADQDAVATIASSLAPLNADNVVDEKPANVAQFGLDSPSLTLTVKRTNGKSDVIRFGDDVPTGSLVYAEQGSGGKVYAVASATKSGFEKTVADLRDKRLLTLSTDQAKHLELASTKGLFAFDKNAAGEWQISKPAPSRADSFQVSDLLTKLQGVKMSDANLTPEDQKKAVALYATAQPVGTAKLSDGTTVQSLELRKVKTDYYAKSSVVPGVFKISADLNPAFDKTLADFRNRKLYDFGFNDPTKLTYENGSIHADYRKAGSDWKQDGKKLDAASLQAVIDQLRDLSAAAFPLTGFVSPTISITVVSQDGKRTEKVQFSKTPANYIAKRDNEPALYAVTTKAMDDLRKALSEVKPAPPTKK